MNILLVEDNEGDVFLFQEIIKGLEIQINLSIERNGVAAWGFIQNHAIDLILLDINLPLMNGFELLAQIKQREEYSTIPIVCLSTSSNPSDIKKAYLHQANAFFIKPSDPHEFESLCKTIIQFWNMASNPVS